MIKMSINDCVVDFVAGKPVYGQRFYDTNIARALSTVESFGLRAITGVEGANAKIVAPFEDPIWNWFTTLTGVYNVVDHEGRFGRRGQLVNVVAHGCGHPLARSQRVLEALATDYTRQNCVAQLIESEERGLLSEEGTPIFSFEIFRELSEDPEFLKKDRNFRVVRSVNVLDSTMHGVQRIADLYNNSSILVYMGGNARVRIPGSDDTVPRAEYFINRVARRFNVHSLGVWLFNIRGGYLLGFGHHDTNYDSFGYTNLLNFARFIAVKSN